MEWNDPKIELWKRQEKIFIQSAQVAFRMYSLKQKMRPVQVCFIMLYFSIWYSLLIL